MIDWLDFLATQPGFDRVQVGDVDAVEVPTYEAVYLAQRLAVGREATAYIEPEDGEPIQFPRATPAVRIREIEPTLVAGHDDSIDKQINPLLAPSFAHLREKVPEFFDRDVKYITTRRYEAADLGDLNQIHRVCLSAPEFENELGEDLTEYLVSMYLRRKGFIVDSFNGGLPGHGGPDLYAVALPTLQTTLTEAGLIGGGCYLAELELPDVKPQATRLPDQSKAIVIEVESAYDSNRFYQGKDEAREYAADGWFDEAYGAMGFVEDRLANWEGRLDVGFITFNAEGEFIEVPCSTDYGTDQKVVETRERVRRVVKRTLLKNRPLVDVLDSHDARSFYDASRAVDDMPVTALLDALDFEVD